jgi:peptide/nickel transport system substrate-binding protein
MHARVAAVEAPDPQRVRFRLKQPWSDFLTFYGSATGAGWIVPKRYIETVGDDGFKKAPIGAGPYRFVSFKPGIELVLEAVGSYWRKTPTVRRIVLRAIPEGATRLAALTRGEVDIAYHLTGELAEGVERTRGLTLEATVVQTPFWLYFPEQWDAKSPWHDRRVRLAAGLAINRAAINQAVTGWPFADHRQHRPRQLRALLATTCAPIRSGQGQTITGRGGLPKRFRGR